MGQNKIRSSSIIRKLGFHSAVEITEELRSTEKLKLTKACKNRRPASGNDPVELRHNELKCQRLQFHRTSEGEGRAGRETGTGSVVGGFRP